MSDYMELVREWMEFNDEPMVWNDSFFGDDMGQHRQRHFDKYADAHNLKPLEALIPRVYCVSELKEPGFIRQQRQDHGMSRKDILDAVESMRPWGFYFRMLDDITTEHPVEIEEDSRYRRMTRNRTLCRSQLITDTVVRLMGDSLHETRVLDMGANCGFFSFDIAHYGAKEVTALEYREDNIARGNFLKSFYGFPQVNFIKTDVMEWEPDEPYDVVYNLGLLYHVIDPIGLLRRTYEWCTDFAVVDTVCHRYPFAGFIPRFEKDTSMSGEGRYNIEMHPTYRGLIDSMHYVGFKHLLELVPMGRVSGLYKNHVRRCIIGFK